MIILIEDAPTNNIGSGNIAKKETPDSFGGHAVFDVNHDSHWKSRFGKKPYTRYANYVGLDETGEKIRQYARKNPRKGVILRNSITGSMIFLRRPLNEMLLLEEKGVTEEDIKKLEMHLDALFKPLGMGVEFKNHFFERLNDARNGKQITIGELVTLFRDCYVKFGKTLSKLPDQSEAVLKDIRTDINLPFILKLNKNNGLLELNAKTILRKKGFYTSDPIYTIK